VAAAETRDELHALIRQAIGMHVESLRHHGEPVPEPAAVDVEVVQPA
jgi:predicted RNase H-like HicB family nuclease